MMTGADTLPASTAASLAVAPVMAMISAGTPSSDVETISTADSGQITRMRPGSVPVELVGTAFQLRVWQALMRIPAGETRSYAELAASLDAPKAARAVASACASNRVAVLVPCHRVIRGDGSLGGYRWGLPRKQALLQSESPSPRPHQKNRA